LALNLVPCCQWAREWVYRDGAAVWHPKIHWRIYGCEMKRSHFAFQKCCLGHFRPICTTCYFLLCCDAVAFCLLKGLLCCSLIDWIYRPHRPIWMCRLESLQHPPVRDLGIDIDSMSDFQWARSSPTFFSIEWCLHCCCSHP